MIQKKLGLAGTTEKEAMTTIEGSINAVTNAWDNFLISLSTGDIDVAFEALVSTGEAALDNIVEMAETVINTLITNLPRYISRITPKISSAISKILGDIQKYGPSFVSALGDIIDEIVLHLPPLLTQIIDTIAAVLPTIIDTISDWINGGGLADLLEAGLDIITAIATGIDNNIDAVFQCISDMIDQLAIFIDTHPDEIQKLLLLAASIMTKIAEGIKENQASLNGALSTCIGAVVDWISTAEGKTAVWSIASAAVNALVDGIKYWWNAIWGNDSLTIPTTATTTTGTKTNSYVASVLNTGTSSSSSKTTVSKISNPTVSTSAASQYLSSSLNTANYTTISLDKTSTKQVLSGKSASATLTSINRRN